jgi:hypothetical protein
MNVLALDGAMMIRCKTKQSSAVFNRKSMVLFRGFNKRLARVVWRYGEQQGLQCWAE